MQQIQQLCGADDSPQMRMNTGDSQDRGPLIWPTKSQPQTQKVDCACFSQVALCWEAG